MLKYIVLSTFLMSSFVRANYIDDNVKKMKWNGIDVVWLQDSTLPTYDISIYFGEGALGDRKALPGATEITLNQLTSGTSKYSQKEIIESLEFFGASYGSAVTHEFSDFSVSGLVKDFEPTMKMVCHLFQDASFPKTELNVLKARTLSSLKSIVTNHGALANHIFRYETLKGTGYESSVQGTIESLSKITPGDLKARLGELNQLVKKRIYIKGPKKLLELEKIIKDDCKWKGTSNSATYPVVKEVIENKEIIFVSVPKANQAQVRIGRIMTSSEVKQDKNELMAFSAKFMGGGFTSRLVQGLRVERGLTYSAGAYASAQSSYGRSGITTFTKNETIHEILEATKSIVEKASTSIDEKIFERSKRNIKGNYLLGLESTSKFLKNLMFFDHRGIKYDEIYKFQKAIDKISKKDLAKMNGELFNWNKQTIVVLGDKSLIPVLKAKGHKVKEVDYKSYL